MSPIARRTGAVELLDTPGQDPAELAASLHHVAQVNRWLGGRRALLGAVRPFLRDGLRVLDLGSGAGDLPVALARDARRRGLRISITASDPHPAMRALAARTAGACPEVEIAAADALALPWPADSFDVALFSLVLHHFEDAQAGAALREAARCAPVVIINELHRTRLNYVGARLLAATHWRSNRITRHDGPLSVLRAYTPAELAGLACAAGLHVQRLERRWFYRLVLIAGRA